MNKLFKTLGFVAVLGLIVIYAIVLPGKENDNDSSIVAHSYPAPKSGSPYYGYRDPSEATYATLGMGVGYVANTIEDVMENPSAMVVSFSAGEIIEDDYKRYIEIINPCISGGELKESSVIFTVLTDNFKYWISGREYVAIVIPEVNDGQYSVVGVADQCLFWVIDGTLFGCDDTLVTDILQDATINNTADLLEYLYQCKTE